MKRNRLLPVAVCCLALLAASCSTDEDDGTTLPDGKYPMTFAAQVDGLVATRATTDNTWAGDEEVAVQIGSEVKRYTAAQGGTLSAASSVTPFYWQTSGETKTVGAWYCGDGSTANGKANASSVPATWTVQSGQNTGNGYQQSDFLYAPATTISFANRNSTSLTFYHQTAKVVINIVNAEAATDAGQITSVVIGNSNNIALSGNYAAPASGVTAGTWSNHTGAGTITPKSITATGSYLKSYAALVIPQDMTGQKFIAVTLADGNTYYYTPKNGDGNLQSGKLHTYNITVKYGYLEVTTATGGEWGDGGSEAIASIAEGFSAADLKPGDYYYSDGTTSDGGYRKYTDGSTGLLGVMPDLSKTCIGIVYCVDNSFITSNSTKKSEGGFIHGLVVALKDASSSSTWYNAGGAASDYGNTVVAPSGSSGWYLPNWNELKYICWGNNSSQSTSGKDNLNTQFNKLSSGSADDFGGGYYWSSTDLIYGSSYAFYVNFDDGYVNYYYKTNTYRVRCVLAF